MCSLSSPSVPPRSIITRWQTGQVLERTLDCWWDWWWRRQVITERLETVLVRNVLHPNELPVRCGVRILSLSHLRKRRSCLVAMRRTSPFNLLRQDEVWTGAHVCAWAAHDPRTSFDRSGLVDGYRRELATKYQLITRSLRGTRHTHWNGEEDDCYRSLCCCRIVPLVQWCSWCLCGI